MRLKKLIALVSSVAMLGTVSAVIPITASAAETTLLDQPMGSETAVNGVKDKYEPMVATNDKGVAADIDIKYTNAGAQYPCLDMKNKNGWYGSAGLKYDITDLVAGKEGALTITADLSAGNSYEANATIGFMFENGTKVSNEAVKIQKGAFEMVTYTADSIPSNGDKLYFFAATGNPVLRIRNLKLTLSTEDIPAVLPVNDETFNNSSIPKYYTTTGTAGLSADGTCVIAKNKNADGSDKNIDADSEFITINLGETQLKAGDVLKFSFDHSNGNFGTASAAKVYLNYGDKSVEAGATKAFTGQSGKVFESFSEAITVPADYSGEYVKLVLKVSASTGSPRIKNVKISKTDEQEPVGTHKEGFSFTAALSELQDKVLKITAKNAEGKTATAVTPYSDLSITQASGTGEVVLGIIIENIPYGTTITSAVFE